MKKRVKHMAVMLIFMAVAAGPSAAEDIRRVKAMEFRGLKYLTKYDIIRGVRLKAVQQGIVVDMDSLKHALANNSFIQGYRMDEREGGLIITVSEKHPAYVVVMSKGEKSVIYELDSSRTIISMNDVHAADLPILYISGRDIGIEALQGGIKRLFTVLDRVRAAHAPVYRELSEVYFDGARVRILLRGRRTEFLMMPDENDFIKLRYIAGYLDRARHYPDEIVISGTAAVIR
jgi:hypothetical protein